MFPARPLSCRRACGLPFGKQDKLAGESKVFAPRRYHRSEDPASHNNIIQTSVPNLNKWRMQLLPWEILQGLKMDLNRPFGNGAFSLNPSYSGTLTLGSWVG